MFVTVLFLDYIPVKSLFYGIKQHFGGSVLQFSTSYCFLVKHALYFSTEPASSSSIILIKNILRYGCGFHTPKNTKMLFSSKIGSSTMQSIIGPIRISH